MILDCILGFVAGRKLSGAGRGVAGTLVWRSTGHSKLYAQAMPPFLAGCVLLDLVSFHLALRVGV